MNSDRCLNVRDETVVRVAAEFIGLYFMSLYLVEVEYREHLLEPLGLGLENS